MRPDELERRLRARLDALGPAPRAELLHVLTLRDFDRVGAIQSYCPRCGQQVELHDLAAVEAWCSRCHRALEAVQDSKEED